jgi:hypothetical protein
MSVVYCFSRRFCVSLQKSVAENAESYRDGTIGSLLNDSLDDAGTQIETEFRIDPTLVLAPPTGGSGELLGDAENAIRLHRALSSLTPLQASDERLWAWLCHIPFRDYVAQRHLGDLSGVKLVNKIRSRFFVAGRDSRALMRNALARLWWGASLTYDKAAEDPYELTRVLFFRQETVKNLLENNFGRSRRVLSMVLRYFEERPEFFRDAGGTTKKVVIGLAKECNARGGYGLLDTMSEQRLQKFLEDSLSRVLGSLGVYEDDATSNEEDDTE